MQTYHKYSLLFILCVNFGFAQSRLRVQDDANPIDAGEYSTPYQYLSPTPNSTYNTARSSIIMRVGSLIEEASLTEGTISAVGSKSGKISGQLILSSDLLTIIYKPHNPFLPDEKVEITINGIRTIDGKNVPSFAFAFLIEPGLPTPIIRAFENSVESSSKERNYSKSATANLPQIRTNIIKASAIGDGKIFLSAYGVINQSLKSDPAISSSIMIVNNDGTFHFSKDIGSNQGAGLTDFKMHSNGLMSYPKVLKNYPWTGGGEVIHMVMNRSFAVIDSFQMGNGYTAETHDFVLLPNGHALLMAYYLVPIDLSQIVPGSNPNPFIDGAVIQELDADKNVVFQWRTWDYVNPQNIPWNLVPGNTQQIINVFHLNSIKLDNDGNLLLGTPGMGMKVSRQTGKIVWIIGGMLNQFTFTNVAPQEALGDFGGHTFQRLANGNILVLDNSPFPWQTGYGTISSEVVEYKINEDTKIAELVWKYKPEINISGWHAGSAQRLSNGNTVICWGGPPAEGNVQIPIMTEVTSSGEKVFELFYEGSELESYRAFRFPLDDGVPTSEITKMGILALNTYEFKENGKTDPGIAIKINEMTGVGYTVMTVKNYSTAPSAPEFTGKAPLVFPRRVVVSNFGIASINADIRFDIQNWGVTDPTKTLIYYRKNENKGMFIPLETTYNFVTGKLTAKFDGFGEFILATPDFASLLLAPIPNDPKNGSSVNYKVPVQIAWSPMGFAKTYSLQISLDSNFTNVVIDEKSLNESKYTPAIVKSHTNYYWRVKTQNDAGDGPWCATQLFKTVDPFILIKKPNGGEQWNIGLEYSVEWNANIKENVNISLLKNQTVIKNITTTGNLFYLWEIPLTLMLADDYTIQIRSTTDSTLFDVSDRKFSIVNTVSSVNENENIPTTFSLSQNFPNPFNPGTRIEFALPVSSFTSIVVYNSLGQEVSPLVNEELSRGRYSVEWNAYNFPSGVYYCRMVSGSYSGIKKLILLK